MLIYHRQGCLIERTGCFRPIYPNPSATASTVCALHDDVPDQPKSATEKSFPIISHNVQDADLFFDLSWRSGTNMHPTMLRAWPFHEDTSQLQPTSPSPFNNDDLRPSARRWRTNHYRSPRHHAGPFKPESYTELFRFTLLSPDAPPQQARYASFIVFQIFLGSGAHHRLFPVDSYHPRRRPAHGSITDNIPTSTAGKTNLL